MFLLYGVKSGGVGFGDGYYFVMWLCFYSGYNGFGDNFFVKMIFLV